MSNTSSIKKRHNQRDLSYPIFNRHLFIKLREGMNLSRDEMAVKIHESVRTISSWETGEVMPTSNKTQSIADGLDIPVSRISIDRELCYQLQQEQHHIESFVRAEVKKDYERRCIQLNEEYTALIQANDHDLTERLKTYGIDPEQLAKESVTSLPLIRRIMLMIRDDLMNDAD